MGEIYENTADLTFALLMAAARRIPEADRYVREGRYGRWEPAGLLGGDIYGKTLGMLMRYAPGFICKSSLRPIICSVSFDSLQCRQSAGFGRAAAGHPGPVQPVKK